MEWLKKWTFEETKEKFYNGLKCREWRATFAGFSKPELGSGSGVDPGRNFGLATTWGDGEVMLRYLALEGDSLGWAMSVHDLLAPFMPSPIVVEGPAYGAVHGQVDLERVRMGVFFGAECSMVSIVPPMTIRKEIFGDGFRKAEDVWGDQFKKAHYHVLDAFGALLYAVGWRWDDFEEGK